MDRTAKRTVLALNAGVWIFALTAATAVAYAASRPPSLPPVVAGPDPQVATECAPASPVVSVLEPTIYMPDDAIVGARPTAGGPNEGIAQEPGRAIKSANMGGLRAGRGMVGPQVAPPGGGGARGSPATPAQCALGPPRHPRPWPESAGRGVRAGAQAQAPPMSQGSRARGPARARCGTSRPRRRRRARRADRERAPGCRKHRVRARRGRRRAATRPSTTTALSRPSAEMHPDGARACRTSRGAGQARPRARRRPPPRPRQRGVARPLARGAVTPRRSRWSPSTHSGRADHPVQSRAFDVEQRMSRHDPKRAASLVQDRHRADREMSHELADRRCRRLWQHGQKLAVHDLSDAARHGDAGKEASATPQPLWQAGSSGTFDLPTLATGRCRWDGGRSCARLAMARRSHPEPDVVTALPLLASLVLAVACGGNSQTPRPTRRAARSTRGSST